MFYHRIDVGFELLFFQIQEIFFFFWKALFLEFITMINSNSNAINTIIAIFLPRTVEDIIYDENMNSPQKINFCGNIKA